MAPMPSPSQDPETRAQERARWRALMNIRAAGGTVAVAALTVFGVVGVATGHDSGGLTALAFIGVVAIGVIAGWARRRRRGGLRP